ncbi:Zinc finger BED domain-containing protein 4-like [Oopsacas minuta]|uniref:Zinc finger BED domain-containing protein 4-like n=1 Tax=Oopsacas minuta TaxID=111878 RepID=A0AAV7JI44_9METZ|nr:Zinc finger BED domain-containing protein 4-like [Oopsacas minuta]
MEVLRGHQADYNGAPGCTLILGEKTRWSSYYAMLVRYIQQKCAIRCTEDDININIEYQLTPNDWMLIPKVICLLKPFVDATLDAEHGYTCISDTILFIKKIFYELNAIDEFRINTIKNEMIVQLKRYFRGLDALVHFVDVETSEMHALATILDPRYKTSGFMDKAKAEEVKGKFTSIASNIFERSLAEGSFQINADSPAKSY